LVDPLRIVKAVVVTPGNSLNCPYCGRFCKYELSLKRHIADKHGEEKLK